MGVVIETRTDSFATNLSSSDKTYSPRGLVRRPFRGFEIKDDTYATLRIIAADGTIIPLVDAGGPISPLGGEDDGTPTGEAIPSRAGRRVMASTPISSNFIIQSIKDSRQEKFQLMETFGDTYIFFFGERPRILTVQGVLFNTLDFNWRTEFWYNYENNLRGTKLVEQNARVYLGWDDMMVEGYMIGADADDNAEMPYHIPFSFQLFVTNHAYLSPYLGDPMFPTHDGVTAMSPSTDSLTVQSTAGKTKDIQLQTSLTQSSLKNAQYALAGAGLVGTAAGFNALLGRTQQDNVHGTLAKNMALDLIKAGIVAQSATFLNVLARYFRVPLANPQRTTPARSKITDNRDEYVNGSYAAVAYDRAAQVAGDARIKALQTAYQIESAFMASMQLLQISSTQLDDPNDGVSPMSQQHRFQVAGTPPGQSTQSVIGDIKGSNRIARVI
jgi:hypothetical protein